MNQTHTTQSAKRKLCDTSSQTIKKTKINYINVRKRRLDDIDLLFRKKIKIHDNFVYSYYRNINLFLKQLAFERLSRLSKINQYIL